VGLSQAVPQNRSLRASGLRWFDRSAVTILLASALIAVSMTGWAVFSRNTQATPTPPPPEGYGYWSASGPVIRDSLGRPVRIAGVTWFGAESSTWVPGGLDFQPYTKIMNLVKKLGYNTIRLTFSNELWERDPIVHRWVAANPSFRGKRAWTVMDAIVAYAGKIGLKIIFDDQRSVAAPADPAHPGRVSALDEPLWYTPNCRPRHSAAWTCYPQSAWLHDWEAIARHYRGNDAVIGFDLRNEPHTDGLLATRRVKRLDPACRTKRLQYFCDWDVYIYLHNGATWGPFDGRDIPATDWRLAAEKAGDAVLKINNSLLIFVEGLQLYPDQSGRQPVGGLQSCGSGGRLGCVDSYWWGGILKQVRQYPVVLSEPSQLVYSPHEYGPRKVKKQWFANMTYKSLAGVLYQQWGFITQTPTAPYTAPIFLGETGTCTNHFYCYRTQAQGNQARWLHLLVRYLKFHPNVGWSLWALNGTNALDEPSTDGLLNTHWNGVARPYLQHLLATIQKLPADRTSLRKNGRR
jgi:endoglucanase